MYDNGSFTANGNEFYCFFYRAMRMNGYRDIIRFLQKQEHYQKVGMSLA